VDDDRLVWRGDLTNGQRAPAGAVVAEVIERGRPPMWGRQRLIDGRRWRRPRRGAPQRDMPERYGPQARIVTRLHAQAGMSEALGVAWA
jgi:hypothetical protein